MKTVFLTIALLLVGSQSIAAPKYSGTIKIDGSSTVFPISAAIAEEFQAEKEFRKVRVTVAYHGTGGGFKKWCRGETDINDASRPIKAKEQKCAADNNITYVPLKVAYDGISVVASKQNKFLTSMTKAQLKALWQNKSNIKKWSDLNPQWPNTEVKLYGPGTDSGTYDYFVETILGKKQSARSDFVASENDNILVKGVKKNPNAMAFFGYAYYLENKKDLKVIALSEGKADSKAIAPSDASIKDQSYMLARPIFIYVSSKSAARPEVREFVKYYLKRGREIAKQVGYTPLSEADMNEELAKFNGFTSKLVAR